MKLTYALLSVILMGCASVAKIPTDPNEQAAFYLTEAAHNFEKVGPDQSFVDRINLAAEKPKGIDQIRALFVQNPRMAEAYRAYIAKSCAEVVEPFAAVDLKRKLPVERRIFGDAVGDQLDEILDERVGAGAVPFLLDDDYLQFAGLRDTQHRRQIADRTIVVLQTPDSPRRPTAALFGYVSDVGSQSDEGKRIEALLPTLNLRREELPEAAKVYPRFAMELEAKFVKQEQMPLVSIGEVAWKRLSPEQRDRIEAVYRVETFDSSRFARVIYVQGVNESTPGTTAGAQVGSAIGQAQYIDHSNWHNYSATGQIAAGILGAVVGSMLDRAPTVTYRLVYTLRDADGNVRVSERVSSSPIYVAPGLCIDTYSFAPVRDEQCESFPREVAELLRFPPTAAGWPPSSPANVTPTSVSQKPVPSGNAAPASTINSPLRSPGMNAVGSTLTPSNTAAPSPVLPPATVAREPTPSGKPGPVSASRHIFSAERVAKTAGCSDPVAVMNSQTPSFETFTVTCSNGDPLSIRCDGSACRELK